MKDRIRKTSIILVLAALLFAPTLAFTRDTTQEDKWVIPGSYSATITWVTDKPSTSQVEYGTDGIYKDITSKDTNLVTHHKVILYDLTPSTLYHYRVRSKDDFGNEAVSTDFSFVTLKGLPEDRPPQISDVEAATIIAAGPAGQVKEEKIEVKEPIGPTELDQETGELIKEEEPIEKALIEKGGLLLSKGKWQIESTFTYAHISANRISLLGFTILPVLVVGEISSEEVKRDIFIETLTSRYGLTDNLQIEVKVPYRYQYDRISVNSGSETTRHLHGIGDIEAGIYRQIAHEKGVRPDVIAGISVKSRTGKEPYGRDIGLGTGHWSVKGGVVWVKSSDPAIVFGGLGYTYNVERDNIDGYGKVKPGDTFDYRLGVAFALNYQVALTFQFEHLITGKMDVNEDSVPGSFTNVVNFKPGMTWSIGKDFSCDVSTSFGLSTDSPDYVIEVRFPYTF